MSRTLTVACVLLVTGLAYAAGVATFTWVPEELRCPCDKTELEWRLVANAIRQDKPVKLSTELDIVSMTATAKAVGLIVNMNTTRRPDIRKIDLGRNTDRVLWHIKNRFGNDKAFEDWRNFYLLFHVDGKLLVVRTFRFFKALPENATRTQQLETIQQALMGAEQ